MDAEQLLNGLRASALERIAAAETPEQLDVRLRNAKTEMAAWRDYRYTMLSGTPMQDFENFRGIMQAERLRSSRMELNF